MGCLLGQEGSDGGPLLGSYSSFWNCNICGCVRLVAQIAFDGARVASCEAVALLEFLSAFCFGAFCLDVGTLTFCPLMGFSY